jgi:hypothetical protein
VVLGERVLWVPRTSRVHSCKNHRSLDSPNGQRSESHVVDRLRRCERGIGRPRRFERVAAALAGFCRCRADVAVMTIDTNDISTMRMVQSQCTATEPELISALGTTRSVHRATRRTRIQRRGCNHRRRDCFDFCSRRGPRSRGRQGPGHWTPATSRFVYPRSGRKRGTTYVRSCRLHSIAQPRQCDRHSCVLAES